MARDGSFGWRENITGIQEQNSIQAAGTTADGQPTGLQSVLISLAGTPLEGVVESAETPARENIYPQPAESTWAYQRYMTLVKNIEK